MSIHLISRQCRFQRYFATTMSTTWSIDRNLIKLHADYSGNEKKSKYYDRGSFKGVFFLLLCGHLFTVPIRCDAFRCWMRSLLR